MYSFFCYIPVSRDVDLTKRAVASVVPQLRKHTDRTYPVLIIDNTEGEITLEDAREFEKMGAAIETMKVGLLHGQSINWMVRDAKEINAPFCMSLHNDAVLHDGAVDEIIAKYEEIKDTPWSSIFLGSHNGDAFVLWNPEFFYKEKIWHLPFLHPFYYLDNTMYRMMQLRNWKNCSTEHDLITHEGSHTIKKDPVWQRINNVCFKYHGMIYNEIWNGYPGHEKSADLTLTGIYPLPKGNK